MTPEHIPILDLGPEIDELWEELLRVYKEVLRSGRFIMGPNVSAFEAEMCAYLGMPHAIAVNSGTDALVIGLRSLGIGPGDEVITTPFTFFATAEAISVLGATPVFCDIEPRTFNIDSSRVESLITDRTRAVLPVSLFGQPADLEQLEQLAARRGLLLMEDCAQAFGAMVGSRRAGTFGDAGAFSFFPSKNLGAIGDAGLLTTNDDRVADSARMLRAHGGRRKYHNEQVGYNSRLDELQAAILRLKLRRMDAANCGRRRVARLYSEALTGIEAVQCPSVVDGTTHVFHQYTVRILDGKRDFLAESLRTEGIDTMIYYPVALHRLPVYSGLDLAAYPLAEQATHEVLSLPIWPEMSEATVDRVATSLGHILAS